MDKGMRKTLISFQSQIIEAAGKDFDGILAEARKQAFDVVGEHIINLDADPYVPGEWKVEEHKKGGQLNWDTVKINLYLSQSQQNGKYVQGHKLRKELANQPVLNANVLDFLHAHPELIPKEWKGKRVYFWGTIYSDSLGILYVRCLYFREGRWRWNYRWFDFDWIDGEPAALLAS